MKEKTKLPVGVSVLLTNKDHDVLLGIRLNSKAAGLLSTPGGRLEENESLDECAEREVYEETGLVIHRHDLRLLGFKEHRRYGDHYIMVYYQIEWNGFPLQNKEPDKCEGWNWRTIADINPEECTEPTDILEMLKPEPRISPKREVVVGSEVGDALWQSCLSLVEKCRVKTPDKWDFAHELAALCEAYAVVTKSSGSGALREGDEVSVLGTVVSEPNVDGLALVQFGPYELDADCTLDKKVIVLPRFALSLSSPIEPSATCPKHTRSLQHGKVLCELPVGHTGHHKEGLLEWDGSKTWEAFSEIREAHGEYDFCESCQSHFPYGNLKCSSCGAANQRLQPAKCPCCGYPACGHNHALAPSRQGAGGK